MEDLIVVSSRNKVTRLLNIKILIGDKVIGEVFRFAFNDEFKKNKLETK